MTVTGFEYGAILKGSQTFDIMRHQNFTFEYGAILKGSQTYKKNEVSYELV